MNDRVLALESKVAGIYRMVLCSLILTVLFGLLRIFRVLPDFQPPAVPAPSSAPSGNSNAVNIGAALPAISGEQSRKDYLTTAEVASRENIAERTLLTWIEQGRIQPAPEKSSRAWLIPVNYRIQPPSAAPSR